MKEPCSMANDFPDGMEGSFPDSGDSGKWMSFPGQESTRES